MSAALLLIIPLLAAIVIPFAPARTAKWIALGGSLAALGWAIAFAIGFPHWTDGGYAPSPEAVPAIPGIGRIVFAADSVSLLLVLLTVVMGPLCVLASFTSTTTREREFYAWLLVLEAAVLGVFLATDILTFYVCFEASLIPGFFLVAIWGGDQRRKAALKFFIYTFVGSLFMLAGLLYLVFRTEAVTGALTFAIDDLTAVAADPTLFSGREQAFVLLALMLGFGFKVPLFPFHTWLPLAHNQAPTAGSVNFAAVILKLGTYGIWRVVLPAAPQSVVEYAPLIGVLAVIGIIYAALVCWVQTDVKRLIAYSSVSHMGFCVLGLFALNPIGAQGSVMYMINHGLASGALFLCVGMMYERYHTKSLEEVGGLARTMPVWAFFVAVFTFASVGLPGLNGFVSEFLCLAGTFVASPDAPGDYPGVLGPWYALFAGSGVILGAMYLLYMVGKLLFGPVREPRGHHAHETLPGDLNAREILTLTPLAVLCLVIGVWPFPALSAIEASAERTLAVYPDLVRAHVDAMADATDAAPTDDALVLRIDAPAATSETD